MDYYLHVTIEVEEDCRRLGIFVATSSAEKVKVEQSPEELRREVESIKEEIKGEDLTRNPVVRAYREFYWRIGLDPTKVRPSGEALRRRLINGRDFPFINNVVDSGNLASVRTLVPIGLYDLDKVKGTPRITVSRGGESFHPIGGNVDSLSSGIPIMRDDEKVMHVFLIVTRGSQLYLNPRPNY